MRAPGVSTRSRVTAAFVLTAALGAGASWTAVASPAVHPAAPVFHTVPRLSCPQWFRAPLCSELAGTRYDGCACVNDREA